MASRERQRGGRLGVFFVSVPEPLAALDGREQQLQYQALLSVTADWIHRPPGCSLPTPPPSLSHGDFFFSPRLSQTDILALASQQRDSSPGSRSRGLKRRSDVLPPRGQRALPAGGPGRTAGKRTSTGHSGCFYTAVCRVGRPEQLFACSERALCARFWWRFTPKMGPKRAVIVPVTPPASLANPASLCCRAASYAQLNRSLIIPARKHPPAWLRVGDFRLSYCLEVGPIRADMEPVPPLADFHF